MASFALTNSLVLFSFVSSWPSSLFMAEEGEAGAAAAAAASAWSAPSGIVFGGDIPGHPIKMMYYHSTAQRRSSVAKWVDYVFR